MSTSRFAIPLAWTLLLLSFMTCLLTFTTGTMSITKYILPSLIALHRPARSTQLGALSNNAIDLNWYPPNASAINSLASAINGSGVYGFTFNSSVTPGAYGVYNWCNMPHVRSTEYPKASTEYVLEYVEVVGYAFLYCIVVAESSFLSWQSMLTSITFTGLRCSEFSYVSI